MENKKKYLLMILGIVLISILGTFAWLTWKSKDTSLVLTIGDIGGTTVTLKPYMIEQSLIPTLTYEGNDAVNVTAKNNGTTENDIVLYYKINNINEELITDSFKYTVLKSIDNGETYEEYQTGNFASSVSDEEYVIMTETIPANTTYKYRVYTWLDGENETSSNIQGKSFKAELRASIFNGSVVTVDVPSGLIPVTIANDGTVTSISKEDSSWYDYNNKLWANGVLVTESSRSSYLNTTGVTIPESDILAYYVYVPRYKYKIWTTGTSSAGNEQEIEILFENIDVPKSKGARVGEYRTHPGFTFGSDELNGIWVGKFETTGTEEQPTVKPNTTALENQNISTQFKTSLKFAGGTLSNNGVTTFNGSNTYGLSNNTNSHMTKNTEWSAASYLSHSRYGINSEVRINNYGEYTDDFISLGTGCGASSDDADGSNACQMTYGSVTTYPQSTTGNISGIFDMSGGLWERVMGVLANSDEVLFSNSVYYDIYKSSSDTTIEQLTACNSGYCYGHGLSEVSGWYGDYASFVFFGQPWIMRGGFYIDGINAGAFSLGYSSGESNREIGFRSILVDTNSKDKTVNLSVDLNGGTSTQNLAGIYPINKQVNLVNPTRSGYTFDGWKVTSGDGKIFYNKVTDGSFENDSDIYVRGINYVKVLTSNDKYMGNKSMYIEMDAANVHNGTGYIESTSSYTFDNIHTYYYATWYRSSYTFGLQIYSESQWSNGGLINYEWLPPTSFWKRGSMYYHNENIPNALDVVLRLIVSSNNEKAAAYIDNVLMIDLSDTFSIGSEPTKEWLDTHINYFDDYMLYLNNQDTTIQAQWK